MANMSKSLIAPTEPAKPQVTTVIVLLLIVANVSLGADNKETVLPVRNGNISVRADFQEATDFAYRALYGTPIFELRYRIRIQTSSRWKTIKLRFDLGGLCAGQPHQWLVPVTLVPLAPLPPDYEYLERRLFSPSIETKRYGKDEISPLPGIDGCTVEIIKAELASAETETGGVYNVLKPVDLIDELRVIESQNSERDKKAAAEAEERAKKAAIEDAERARKEAADKAERARKESAEAARQKQLAAERKRKATEEANRLAKIKADEEAKAAEERRRIRAACGEIYRTTIDKKLKDLTVREEQQVRGCQSLDLYPPH
jgi:hypothetical protein